MQKETKMTKEELAKTLNDGVFTDGIPSKFGKLAASNMLAIAYFWGDIIALNGAINDDFFSHKVQKFFIVKNGRLYSFDELLASESNEEEFEFYFKNKDKAVEIKIIPTIDNNGQGFKTDIPCAYFSFSDNEERWNGIVFSIEDLPPLN